MKFAFRAADGSVTVVGAAPKADLERVIGTPVMVDGVERRVLTDQEYIDHIIGRNIDKGVIPKDAELVMLPEDWSPADKRAFRSAWILDGNTIDVDMGKAREIHMGRIRIARNRKLDELDRDWMRAAGQKDTKAADAIEAKRQALRDIPQTLDLTKARTPDELKATWPDELKR
jgi:hypothetical protein